METPLDAQMNRVRSSLVYLKARDNTKNSTTISICERRWLRRLEIFSETLLQWQYYIN